ncbi:MAG: hypothetical protein JRE28_16120 [Deltaproteobacteria bacterium]|nr:hypothetical protein [Deltaproteobacteria bacterium]
MENNETDFDLPGEPFSQQSSKKTSRSEVFKWPNGRGDVKLRSAKNLVDSLPWVVENVSFPDGTEFRGKYKGCFYYGEVGNGALVIHGEEFSSLSAAAVVITRNPVDGWLFWECKLPGQPSWMNIHEVKKRNS